MAIGVAGMQTMEASICMLRSSLVYILVNTDVGLHTFGRPPKPRNQVLHGKPAPRLWVILQFSTGTAWRARLGAYPAHTQKQK